MSENRVTKVALVLIFRLLIRISWDCCLRSDKGWKLFPAPTPSF